MSDTSKSDTSNITAASTHRTTDVVIVGGGIVGLATAHNLLQTKPGTSVVLVEKEADLAGHQTGHNSGVLHSGIYYKPGSLKARLAHEGRTKMVEFCREHDIPHEICGKIIVATQAADVPRLDALAERAVANQVVAHRIDIAELREREPHAAGIAALHVPATGITDYAAVCRTMASLITAAGGEIRMATKVTDIDERSGSVRVSTTGGDLEAGMVITCGGLYSDRLAA